MNRTFSFVSRSGAACLGLTLSFVVGLGAMAQSSRSALVYSQQAGAYAVFSSFPSAAPGGGSRVSAIVTHVYQGKDAKSYKYNSQSFVYDCSNKTAKMVEERYLRANGSVVSSSASPASSFYAVPSSIYHRNAYRFACMSAAERDATPATDRFWTVIPPGQSVVAVADRIYGGTSLAEAIGNEPVATSRVIADGKSRSAQDIIAARGGPWSGDRDITDPYWNGDQRPPSAASRAKLDIRCVVVFGAADAISITGKANAQVSDFSKSAYTFMRSDYALMKRGGQMEADYYAFKKRYMSQLLEQNEDLLAGIVSINVAQCFDYLNYRRSR